MSRPTRSANWSWRRWPRSTRSPMSASPASIAISARPRISASSSVGSRARKSSSAMNEAQHMRSALNLARRGLGLVAPNPAVGCVLVKDGVVIGRGWTQPGGRPHAETEALRRAGERARGATAYVTLEPCAHRGQTPPCAEALVAAGIARCVVAIEDPDPRVGGRGVARLRDAGVEISVGLLADEAERVNAGFLKRIRMGRPLVLLKLASTLD